MKLGLINKKVLITGSSRGIGLAIAEGFLQEGAKVALTSRNSPELKRVAARLGKKYAPANILAFECDFENPDQVSILNESIRKQWKGFDILVANVGSGRSVPDAVASKEHFDRLFSLNFNSSVNAVREFLPLIKKTKGNILFISSIAGMEAIGAPVDYSVAKTAVLSFAKNISRKLAKDGVRVNCIAPGNVFFKGGSWDDYMKADPERVRSLITETVPMDRFGTPQEIADAALFLCSKRAGFITGSVLCVDGGQTVTLF